MASCEKCWRDSAVARLYRADYEDPYGALIDQRDLAGMTCTPEEQAGPDATECPVCGLRTVHQYAKVCMTHGCRGPNTPGSLDS